MSEGSWSQKDKRCALPLACGPASSEMRRDRPGRWGRGWGWGGSVSWGRAPVWAEEDVLGETAVTAAQHGGRAECQQTGPLEMVRRANVMPVSLISRERWETKKAFATGKPLRLVWRRSLLAFGAPLGQWEVTPHLTHLRTSRPPEAEAGNAGTCVGSSCNTSRIARGSRSGGRQK